MAKTRGEFKNHRMMHWIKALSYVKLSLSSKFTLQKSIHLICTDMENLHCVPNLTENMLRHNKLILGCLLLPFARDKGVDEKALYFKILLQSLSKMGRQISLL